MPTPAGLINATISAIIVERQREVELNGARAEVQQLRREVSDRIVASEVNPHPAPTVALTIDRLLKRASFEAKQLNKYTSAESPPNETDREHAAVMEKIKTDIIKLRAYLNAASDTAAIILAVHARGLTE